MDPYAIIQGLTIRGIIAVFVPSGFVLTKYLVDGLRMSAPRKRT